MHNARSILEREKLKQTQAKSVAVSCVKFAIEKPTCTQRNISHRECKAPILCERIHHTYLRYRGQHLQAAQPNGRCERLSASDRIAGTEARDERTADHQIADGQKDDRSLRVAEARWIYEKGEHLRSDTYI